MKNYAIIKKISQTVQLPMNAPRTICIDLVDNETDFYNKIMLLEDTDVFPNEETGMVFTASGQECYDPAYPIQFDFGDYNYYCEEISELDYDSAEIKALIRYLKFNDQLGKPEEITLLHDNSTFYVTLRDGQFTVCVGIDDKGENLFENPYSVYTVNGSKVDQLIEAHYFNNKELRELAFTAATQHLEELFEAK